MNKEKLLEYIEIKLELLEDLMNNCVDADKNLCITIITEFLELQKFIEKDWF